jgi:hypothetical protein
MGLLDDAIREHLDLKRRRGADPADIERAEREALGPVRRGPEETEPEEPQLDEGLPYDDEHGATYDEAQPAHYDEGSPAPYDNANGSFDDQRAAPYDDQQPGDWGEAFDPEHEPGGAARHDDPFAEEREPGFEADHRHDEPEARGAVEEQPTQHMSLDFDEEDPFDEPHGGAPPPRPAQADDTRPHGAHPAGGETVEYDVEAASSGKGGKNEEDVLEETPEFLQDTPDHDRLWFEQKPPRDFDFDG